MSEPFSSSRPSLPTSSIDFALPPSSSSSTPSMDDTQTSPLLLRFRRPSIATSKAGFYSEKRPQSPLVASFTAPLKRHPSLNGEESESDKERMRTDSSPSSGSENPTTSCGSLNVHDGENEATSAGKAPLSPSTPPRTSFMPNNMDVLYAPPRSTSSRRLSFYLKPPRILNLLAESRPEENEVQSEAAFQRLIASCSDLPTQPRTPRAPSDRGRYPEEAGDEDAQREDTPSDDEDGDVEGPFAFEAQSEATGIVKPSTPAHSVSGEDLHMSLTGSPVVGAMDVDMPLPSPSINSTPASIQWRYTPPPTTSAVRSTKRKFDDRFDPYPTASKRRAVSPSLSYLRESHPSFVPRTPGNNSRLPIPIAIPVSSVSSAASSPTVTYSCTAMPGSRPVSLGTMSVTSSPIMRPTLGLASPVLRPILRSRRGLDGEERDIEGAGEAVNGLSLG